MTELELYKYLTDNGIEKCIYHNGAGVEDASEFSGKQWNSWEIIVFIPLCKLEELCELIGSENFDDFRIGMEMGYRYVAFDLLQVMSLFDIDPKNIFPRKEEV